MKKRKRKRKIKTNEAIELNDFNLSENKFIQKITLQYSRINQITLHKQTNISIDFAMVTIAIISTLLDKQQQFTAIYLNLERIKPKIQFFVVLAVQRMKEF